MKTRSKVAASVVLMTIGILTGWVGKSLSEQKRCSFMQAGYVRYQGNVSAYPSAVEKPSEKALSTIYECWSKWPYKSSAHPISLKDIRRKSANECYYIFNPQGVSDTKIIFKVNNAEEVKGVFAKSFG